MSGLSFKTLFRDPYYSIFISFPLGFDSFLLSKTISRIPFLYIDLAVSTSASGGKSITSWYFRCGSLLLTSSVVPYALILIFSLFTPGISSINLISLSVVVISDSGSLSLEISGRVVSPSPKPARGDLTLPNP